MDEFEKNAAICRKSEYREMASHKPSEKASKWMKRPAFETFDTENKPTLEDVYQARIKQKKKVENEIGEKIKAARTAVKMSQSELAKMSGASQGNISEYEKGVKKPSAETEAKIFDAIKNFKKDDNVLTVKKLIETLFDKVNKKELEMSDVVTYEMFSR